MTPLPQIIVKYIFQTLRLNSDMNISINSWQCYIKYTLDFAFKMLMYSYKPKDLIASELAEYQQQ